jgi:Uma2 family endonuclease
MFEPALVTAEELAWLPRDDHKYELVAGRVIRMSLVGYTHGRLVMQFGARLGQHTRSRGLGVVVTEVGFKLASNPDTVRAPDLAFLRRERIPSPEPKGFWPGAPDLAVEVLSPEDRPAAVRTRVAEYLAGGAGAVLLIDPDAESLALHRPSSTPTRLRGQATLDLADVVPGFRCSVSDVFER